MSNTYTGDSRHLRPETTGDLDLTSAESPSFAPVPAWERGKRHVRSKSPVEPAPNTLDAPLASSGRNEAGLRSDPLGEPFVLTTRPTLATPVIEDSPVSYGRKAAKRDNSMPLIMGAGVLTLATLGAAGWYATQPRDEGVPELTPGSTAMASAPLVTETAFLPPSPAAAPPATRIPSNPDRAATSVRTASVSRARLTAAAMPTAAAIGIDASGATSLPGEPQPYSGSDPTASTPALVIETPAPLALTPLVAADPVAPEPVAAPEVVN